MLDTLKNQVSGPLPDSGPPRFYIETYGCQMNVADSEVVVSVMQQHGYSVTDEPAGADIVLINTCSVREKAEQRVRGRLDLFRQYKKQNPRLLVGIIGCMAERLKEKLLEEGHVDMVVGPDAYRDLPGLVRLAGTGQKAVNVLLSGEETYGDIQPVYQDKNRISAFVSIMRGCNNRCAYCVVPFTRGRERSRDPESILAEIERMSALGFREVSLIGQNVDSYAWKNAAGKRRVGFSDLLGSVASAFPSVRVRFSTSHPKDMSDLVLHIMSRYENICRHIHLPAQSGSTRILKLMKRGYTREWYIARIEAIRKILPGCAISTDFIAGFCSETEQDHRETLSLMEWAGFDFAYMFKYSERPGTKAAIELTDDIPEEVKRRRLKEIIALQNRISLESKQKDLNRMFEVLAEGLSKKSAEELFGRTSQNKVVVFPIRNYRTGDLVTVKITSCTSATLIGEPLDQKVPVRD